jgi:putative ABC transport system permease protein
MNDLSKPRGASVWSLAWRQLGRDFRAGELRLLVVAVMLAVAALTAVGFFADRINAGLARDARQLLGGDAIVASDQPAPAAFLEQARKLGLATATTAVFPSMGRAPDANGGASRLVTIKAVSPGYPLRGQMRLSGGPGTPEVSQTGAPEAGSVWVDPPLLDGLGLKVGDPLLLGDASLRIARLIVNEPDRGAGFLSFAPRVLMNIADLPCDRSDPAGEPRRLPPRRRRRPAAAATPAVKRYVEWADAQIKAGHLARPPLDSLGNNRPEMRQTSTRREVPEPGGPARLPCCSAFAVGIASTRLRQPAPERLRHCSASSACRRRTIALQYGIEFAFVGADRERRRRARRLGRCTMSSSGSWPGWCGPSCRRRAPGRRSSASASASRC